ncbi:MAG: protein jag [Epsilonproteobacteria bacterium]|nr:protein jag [Campylobacterota bacterium]
MKTIEANTLQDAYLNAAKEFDCSVTELEISIVQNSSSGFLGMFKKTAIIKVSKKGNVKFQRNKKEKHNRISKEENTKAKQNKQKKILNKNPKEEKLKYKHKVKAQETISQKSVQVREPKKQVLKIDINKAVKQIDEDINRLFKESCFEMDTIKVSKYNEDTILLEFSGEDSALLIGKEGYRYKALSYFLYNWINIKYGANIRLEIAEFLKNQEEMIGKYLIPVIQRVKTNGRGQTKVLDGVLIKIALEKLRSEFSEKYVGIKSARSGGRFIVINDFNRKSK